MDSWRKMADRLCLRGVVSCLKNDVKKSYLFHRSLECAKVSDEATANIRVCALLFRLLCEDDSDISRAIISGCFVVGGPIRDIIRWINSIWKSKKGIFGKAPDDIDFTIDPEKFASMGLGLDFMETVCSYIVKLLDGKLLMGICLSVSWSGPDSGTYKININWGKYTGCNQIVLDLSQFKKEENGKIEILASITDDANRRDLTFNSLYCTIGDFFQYVDPYASENLLWFMLLTSVDSAISLNKILDPTGSGLSSLNDDLIDLCGVRATFIQHAIDIQHGDLSQLHTTDTIRKILLSSGMNMIKINQFEDESLYIIFDDNNFIRAFRLLRDYIKGASIAPWLVAAIERWVNRFVKCEYTDDKIIRKISILLQKISKLVPNAECLPQWAIQLMRFFLEYQLKKSNFKLDLFLALIRSASAEFVISWMSVFPEIDIMPVESISFLVSAINFGFTANVAMTFWKNPVLIGSFESDPEYQKYEDQLTAQLATGEIKGKITKERINTEIKKMLVSKNRELVLELFLKAGVSGKVLVEGSIVEPIFSTNI